MTPTIRRRVSSSMELWIGVVPYDETAKKYLRNCDHYLQNPPPGCLIAIGVTGAIAGLFRESVSDDKGLLGLCLVGRPVARMLPQDGSVGEVTRMHLANGLPYGTASLVLRKAAEACSRRGMKKLIAYHDRTRHTGCIYRKAGFKKDGVTRSISASSKGWGSRAGRNQSAIDASFTPKRRWSIDLEAVSQ